MPTTVSMSMEGLTRLYTEAGRLSMAARRALVSAAVQVGEQVQHGLLVRPGEGGAFHCHVGEQGGLGLCRQVCEGAGQGGGVLRIQLAQGGQRPGPGPGGPG